MVNTSALEYMLAGHPQNLLYLRQLGPVEMDSEKIYEQASWLHHYNQGSAPNANWFSIKSAPHQPCMVPARPGLCSAPTALPPPLWMLPL